MIYEAKQGMTESLAAQAGLPPANRSILFSTMSSSKTPHPPRGYEFDAFAAAGAAPMTKAIQTRLATQTDNIGMR